MLNSAKKVHLVKSSTIIFLKNNPFQKIGKFVCRKIQNEIFHQALTASIVLLIFSVLIITTSSDVLTKLEFQHKKSNYMLLDGQKEYYRASVDSELTLILIYWNSHNMSN